LSPKAVAVLAGARDHFQLPLALEEGGLLESLVTDFYWPADRRWFGRTLGRVIPDSLVAKRYCSGLQSNHVHVSRRALAAFAVMKLRRNTALNPYKGTTLSHEARLLARKKNAALFAYSTYGIPAFSDADGRLPYRFLFQMHPHPATARAILQDEMERVPFARASLSGEYEFTISSREYNSLCQEPVLANGWVAASSYTAATLAEHGVPRDRIHVVPYGVDSSAFPARKVAPDMRKRFTVIYVGSMIQRKGLSYLLDAIRVLGAGHVRTVLCGRGSIDHALLGQYSDLPLEVHVNLPREELVRKIHASDVFVLPSLTEGFAHVILETMACGVPVVTTHNTCAVDVMRNDEHGFIVPIRDAVSLADRLTWSMEHREELAEMGRAASQQAATFTWARFRAGIRDAYQCMLHAA
jgi:glycosyltransferase involved in cell wall biosynthesis